jgi:hypothetical protein
LVKGEAHGDVEGGVVRFRRQAEVMHIRFPVLVGVTGLGEDFLRHFHQEGLNVFIQHADRAAVLQGGEAFQKLCPVVACAQAVYVDGPVDV